jgi:hypothetical protein
MEAGMGGRLVPDAFVEEVLRVAKLTAPPRAKGLAYWHRLERDRIRNARPSYRFRRAVKRIRWTVEDAPRRLRNARAALAGEWEASEDD